MTSYTTFVEHNEDGTQRVTSIVADNGDGTGARTTFDRNGKPSTVPVTLPVVVDVDDPPTNPDPVLDLEKLVRTAGAVVDLAQLLVDKNILDEHQAAAILGVDNLAELAPLANLTETKP